MDGRTDGWTDDRRMDRQTDGWSANEEGEGILLKVQNYYADNRDYGMAHRDDNLFLMDLGFLNDKNDSA